MGASGGERVCILCHHRFEPFTPANDPDRKFECLWPDKWADPNGNTSEQICPICCYHGRVSVKWNDGSTDFKPLDICYRCRMALKEHEVYGEMLKR